MANKGTLITTLLLIAVLAGGVWWYFERPLQPVVPPAPAVPEAATGAGTGEPDEPEYPVPERTRRPSPVEAAGEERPDSQAVESAPLPLLEQSDDYLYLVLRRLSSSDLLADWLKRERIVERIVVTVNSLDGPAISLRFWPLEHIEGLPEVERDGGTLRWSKSNTGRYRVPVEILQAIDPAGLADAYFRNYPLFQEAWQRLGLEEDHFNDRLIEIIDHLLGAPTVEPGFAVKQPKVLYQYADPELESQSWGRKLLMRMGPDNAAAVKQWLRAFRAELVRGAEEKNAGTANERE